MKNKRTHFGVIGFEMAAVAEVYLSTLSKLMKPHGIERYFVALLHVCENNGRLTQKDLSTALRKDKVYTMRMVDYLCERGFLKRVLDEKDKRRQLLFATKKGFELQPLVLKSIEKTNSIILQSFNKQEKLNFNTYMNQLSESLSRLPAPEFTIKAYPKKQLK